jgi:hypothetical protein
MLHHQAMIANLQIRSWTARRFDKAVTHEVDTLHQAHAAGRYSKLLVDKAALDPLTKHAGKIRDYHYRMTLPWGDNGDRLLPARQYQDYTATLRGLRDEAERLTAAFVADYPRLVAAAKSHLGTMYDPRDYPQPAEISGRFAVQVDFLPVPDAADFRVDLTAAAVDEIRDSILDTVKERQAAAGRECWLRLQETVGHLAAAMAKDKPIFRDSLVGNLAELVELLPKLNVMDDAALDTLCADIARFLAARVTPADLRRDPALRAETLERATDYLLRIAPHA